MSEVASIAYYKPNTFKSNALCEIWNATNGNGYTNPNFPLMNLFTFSGGLMDRFLLWLTVQHGDFKEINVRGGIDRLTL